MMNIMNNEVEMRLEKDLWNKIQDSPIRFSYRCSSGNGDPFGIDLPTDLDGIQRFCLDPSKLPIRHLVGRIETEVDGKQVFAECTFDDSVLRNEIDDIRRLVEEHLTQLLLQKLLDEAQ